MTSDEKDFIKQQFKTIHEKLDLTITPVKSDVAEIKNTIGIHTEKLSTLELFKEGHQQHHIQEKEYSVEKVNSKRFLWEILAGSGLLGIIIGGFLVFLKGG